MHRVAVRILHAGEMGAWPLERALLDARARNARRLAGLFIEAGADDVEIAGDTAGDGSFGARLRAVGTDVGSNGIVLLGSGAIPLATLRDVTRFVRAARAGGRALANNRYSADVIALGPGAVLRDVPDLPGDNALPRWLEEVAGFEVDDLGRRWRLQVDLDSPLDSLLIGGELPLVDTTTVDARLEAIRRVAVDRRSELVVAGRTSAATLRWLERNTASRIRALVEERGLRASTVRALAPPETGSGPVKPPRSVLGLLLDDRGPEALGAILSELGDAAIVDTRVLMAHRLGVDELAWPAAEDRFASDLLLANGIRDPWLRKLTRSARNAAIPVLLGGHSLVGPGVRLAIRTGRTTT